MAVIGFVTTPDRFYFKNQNPWIKAWRPHDGRISIIAVNLNHKIDPGCDSNVKNSLEHGLRWNMIFVTIPGRFNLKISKFIDNGRISRIIMNLIYKIDRGWFSDVEHCVEHGLKWFRSKVMYLWTFYWGFNHCEYISATLPNDSKIYVRGRNGDKSGFQCSTERTTIIFRPCIDFMYDIMPSNTWCVGNEQQFVELTTVEHATYLQSSD